MSNRRWNTQNIPAKMKVGRVKLKKGTFPDMSGDGKVTKKDILIARGVLPKNKNKKMMAKKKSPRAKAMGIA